MANNPKNQSLFTNPGCQHQHYFNPKHKNCKTLYKHLKLLIFLLKLFLPTQLTLTLTWTFLFSCFTVLVPLTRCVHTTATRILSLRLEIKKKKTRKNEQASKQRNRETTRRRATVLQPAHRTPPLPLPTNPPTCVPLHLTTTVNTHTPWQCRQSQQRFFVFVFFFSVCLLVGFFPSFNFNVFWNIFSWKRNSGHMKPSQREEEDPCWRQVETINRRTRGRHG